MIKMTPREALYYVCLELGPQGSTERADNIHHEEARLRDAVKTLKNFITYHDDADKYIPSSANEYANQDDYIARPMKEVMVEPVSGTEAPFIKPHTPKGDGKERLERWKREMRAKIYPHRT